MASDELVGSFRKFSNSAVTYKCGKAVVTIGELVGMISTVGGSVATAYGSERQARVVSASERIASLVFISPEVP